MWKFLLWIPRKKATLLHHAYFFVNQQQQQQPMPEAPSTKTSTGGFEENITSTIIVFPRPNAERPFRSFAGRAIRARAILRIAGVAFQSNTVTNETINQSIEQTQCDAMLDWTGLDAKKL